MKIFCVVVGLFCLFSSSLTANDWKENRTIVFTPDENSKVHLIKPGESVTAITHLSSSEGPTKKRLRVIGNLQMPKPFSSRGEEQFRRAEFLIDDNLDSLTTKKEKYALYFKGNADEFERHAYYRISKDQLRKGELSVTLPVVKKNNLRVGEGADFGLAIEVFKAKTGRAADDIYDLPDTVLYLPVGEGNSKYQKLKKTFQLPENTVCLLLRLGGTRFEGECWLESPQLKQEGQLIASIPFVKHADRTNNHNYWVGTNLSTRSWPLWQLEINGEKVHEDYHFDRASNVADFYIPLPSDLKEKDEIRLTLKKEPHRAAYAYAMRRVEIIEESAHDLEVITLPRFVQQYAAFGALVETNTPDVTVKVKASANVVPAEQTISFEQPGLHVIEMRAGKAGKKAELTFEANGRVIKEEIQQVIAKESDHIYISSGDEIYIDKEYQDYDYFFKWYLANRVGNWYHFRPSYQWSGFRIADSTVIRHYVELLDQMKVPYAWQVEGRTLAGSRINPSLDVLNTPSFKGKQAHENDGGYYYWNHFKYQGLFSDMAARNRPLGGIFAKHRPIYTDHGTFIHYDVQSVKDMADGARQLVANLNYSKGESSRHTGPSSLFRYFYQAGYKWLGAEQMYGPEEVILSSLRGASRAYYRNEYGTLHAMQWGSHPFTDPKHALRLYMSLAVAYMHGSSHMNTEEALWTDEYMNDRYTESGKQHMFAQHQMLDYIETHTRQGELTSNIAVIQGRNDAWKSFGRGSLWSQNGEKWKFNKATESFDLLKIFYPNNELNYCSANNWFTPTPYGTVDILPVEANTEVMKKYRTLIFLGWNTYDESDFARMRDFVFDGGTLVLSAAHMNAELQPDQPVKFPKNDAVIREMLGENYQQLAGKQEICFGNGRIIYFPQKAYPAEESIRKEYVAVIQEIAASNCKDEKKKGWIESAEKVGFTVWDKGDKRTFYLLNTDWQSDKQVQLAGLICGDKKFELPVRRYHIETIFCQEGLAIHPLSNTTDVLSVQSTPEGWKVTVQTTENDEIQYFDMATGTEKKIALKEAGIHEVLVTKE